MDALAYPSDHLFEEVIQNKVPLLFSTDGDSRIFFEETDGSFGIWAVPPLATDVDGLEVWDEAVSGLGEVGEFGENDAYIYSLVGDPDVGSTGPFGRIAVWGVDETGSVNNTIPYVTAFQIADAIGRPDLADRIDLDAMMMSFDTTMPDTPELMFSIAPIDLNMDGVITPNDPTKDLDGGEIWVWDGMNPAKFLNHGGHLWDTTFPVMTTFDTASENVNALEAVAVTPEPTSPLSLLAMGIGGLGLTLKRKLKPSNPPKRKPQK